jgi:uncharacterized protein (DUF302 family)
MDGLITLLSHFGPEETMDRLDKEISERGMRVFARIHHSALAEEAGLTLRPTEVIIFGNPKGGTPLMQVSQTIGIDLPLKALVWQDESGATWLSYNDPDWLAKRHEIRHQVPGVERVVTAMQSVLAEIASQATKP